MAGDLTAQEFEAACLKIGCSPSPSSEGPSPRPMRHPEHMRDIERLRALKSKLDELYRLHGAGTLNNAELAAARKRAVGEAAYDFFGLVPKPQGASAPNAPNQAAQAAAGRAAPVVRSAAADARQLPQAPQRPQASHGAAA